MRRAAVNLAAMADRSLRRRTRALLRLGPPPVVPDLSPELLEPVLLPKAWTTSTDASVFLPTGATAAERQAARVRRAQPGTGAASVRVRP